MPSGWALSDRDVGAALGWVFRMARGNGVDPHHKPGAAGVGDPARARRPFQ
jgi:hypothetical protein